MKAKTLVLFAVCCLLTAVSSGQWWTGPYQLSSDTLQDVNPATCKEWLFSDRTCLVWQTNRDGDWDIISRFHYYYNGEDWQPELDVTRSPFEDICPAVACCNTWDADTGFWCVWERRGAEPPGKIMASRGDGSTWSAPVQLAACSSLPLDTAFPGVMVVNDTAWVTWVSPDTEYYFIMGTRIAGDTWTDPEFVAGTGTRPNSVRVGRGGTDGDHHPLVVWELGGDIWYTEYLDGAWTAPAEVAPSPSLDLCPDVISIGGWAGFDGPWVTWQSDRDGDWAVYGTKGDTFQECRRWCDASSGHNCRPAGTGANFPVDYDARFVVWVSDRNGNPDIYSRWLDNADYYVDLDPAQDSNPVLTTLDLTKLWCLWQSDRSGNQDIWGSYLYWTGIEEMTNVECRMANGQTIVRGVLSLGAGHDRNSLANSGSCPKPVLLDAAGRRVMELEPGDNDVSHLAPGVYFAVTPHPSLLPEGERGPASGVEHPASGVRRAVILR